MDTSVREPIDDLSGNRLKTFQRLMRFKVRDILLVASLYDNYLFEEDGRLYELIREEFQALSLSHPPEITHVTNGTEAIELLASGERFDLIITTLHIEDMHVVKFAQKLRESGNTTPVVLLAYDNRERRELVMTYDTSVFTRIFIWQGDYRLLIAIIKLIEDQQNIESDTRSVGVQSIILIEDNVSFYSTYLPIIYTEILHQSQRLISEGLNFSHRFLRMRARRSSSVRAMRRRLPAMSSTRTSSSASSPTSTSGITASRTRREDLRSPPW